MSKYDKYVWCEFSYFDFNNKHVLLLYTGKEKNYTGDDNCVNCGKHLKGKTTHLFTEKGNGNFDGVEMVFGTTCVKYAFGAGIGKG